MYKYLLNLPFRTKNEAETKHISQALLQFLFEEEYLALFTHYAIGFNRRGKKITVLPSLDEHDRMTFNNNYLEDKTTYSCMIKTEENDIELSFSWTPEGIDPTLDLILFSTTLLTTIDKRFGDKLWGIFPSLTSRSSIKSPRPPRYHRWLNGNVIWEAFDQRIIGTGTALKNMTLPNGIQKEIKGNYLELNWTTNFFEKSHSNAIEDRLNFYTKAFDWPIDSEYNAYGDQSYFLHHEEPFIQLPEDFSLDDAKTIEKQSIVVANTRSQALLLEPFVTSGEVEIVLYQANIPLNDTEEKTYFTPFPKGKWQTPIRKEPLVLPFPQRVYHDKDDEAISDQVKAFIAAIELPYLTSDKECEWLDDQFGLRKYYVNETKVKQWNAYHDETKDIIASLSIEDCQQALGIACSFGELEVIQALVEHGAEINKISYFDHYPMQWAVKGRYYDIVQWLIEHDANLTIQDPSSGDSILHQAFGTSYHETMYMGYNSKGSWRKKTKNEDLQKYIDNRNQIILLLIKNGGSALLNRQNFQGETVLYSCIQAGDTELSKLLIHHNVDVAINNAEGHTVMELLAMRGEIKFIEEIMSVSSSFDN